jgi:hypothetical protein
LWSGPYNPSANYLYPTTYSDGSLFFPTDLTSEQFPDYSFGNEQENYIKRFPAEFCPTTRYYQGNSAAQVLKICILKLTNLT